MLWKQCRPTDMGPACGLARSNINYVQINLIRGTRADWRQRLCRQFPGLPGRLHWVCGARRTLRDPRGNAPVGPSLPGGTGSKHSWPLLYGGASMCPLLPCPLLPPSPSHLSPDCGRLLSVPWSVSGFLPLGHPSPFSPRQPSDHFKKDPSGPRTPVFKSLLRHLEPLDSAGGGPLSFSLGVSEAAGRAVFL